MGHSGSVARILVVDDDPVIRSVVRFLLLEQRYAVAAVGGTDGALRTLAVENEVDLVILDVKMPGKDGFECCRQIRKHYGPLPVLFLSQQSDVDNRITGFEAGGDDYLAKPFDPRELLSRVGAILARHQWGTPGSTGSVVSCGGMELDMTGLHVTLPGKVVIALTPTEARVLQHLLINEGRIVSRDHILQAAWGCDYESDSNQVEVYIRRLRRKIESSSSEMLIETVRGVGYRFVAAKQAKAVLTAV
ncbi:MAG: response regulator transcription factor [Chloroflexi bacterium]|nr:response regulator transcription factor [Chloroflexota bacterium]